MCIYIYIHTYIQGDWDVNRRVGWTLGPHWGISRAGSFALSGEVFGRGFAEDAVFLLAKRPTSFAEICRDDDSTQKLQKKYQSPVRGNHLSNTICLTHDFFNGDE